MRQVSCALLLICWGCGGDDPASSDDGGQPASTGGAVASGGTSPSGGAATGGAMSSGGSAPTSGGAASDGGAVTGGDGGMSSTGGTNSGGTASGGLAESGGAASGGAASGGAGPATGGAGPVVGTFVPDPSWTCGMPDGIVDPEQGELVFEATLLLETHELGATQFGTRRFSVMQDGSVEGDEISATFLEGGLDFELTLDNGTVELEQVATLRDANGGYIYLRTCGVAPAGDEVVRIVPDFEVANQSSLAWLNTGNFVGTRTLGPGADQMTLAVYDVSMVNNQGPSVEWADPPAIPHQPWECHEVSGARGAEVFTEDVGIGASLSVGASKRGTRNIIPITGGTVSGRFNGSILNAGADYQLLGGTATLDARYVLESDEGEFVIVRNCGPFGALIPFFEARADGPYGFLNENRFLSSDPGSAAGGVSITFYELQ